MSYATTTPQNPFAAESLVVVAPIAAATPINQGDFVKIVSNLLVVCAAINEAPHGIADQSNPVTSIGGDDPLLALRVIRKGIVFRTLVSGDTANYDDALYLSNVDNQSVTTSSANSATKIGRSRSLAAVVGDGSKKVLCEVDFDAI